MEAVLQNLLSCFKDWGFLKTLIKGENPKADTDFNGNCWEFFNLKGIQMFLD